MSKLDVIRRQVVNFDVTNKEHREAVARFIKTGTWGYHKYMFNLDEVNLDLTQQLNKELVRYYLSKEFKNLKKQKQK
jgi:hypothetical protein